MFFIIHSGRDDMDNSQCFFLRNDLRTQLWRCERWVAMMMYRLYRVHLSSSRIITSPIMLIERCRPRSVEKENSICLCKWSREWAASSQVKGRQLMLLDLDMIYSYMERFWQTRCGTVLSVEIHQFYVRWRWREKLAMELRWLRWFIDEETWLIFHCHRA